MPAYRDPDENLVVLFRYLAVENPQKTLAEGRPIFDDLEVCEIRSPASKEVKVFRASDPSADGWVVDPYTGHQKQRSYAERFRHQYQQFKASAAQTKSGTPLDHAPFLTNGRRAELRAQNVYTVEMLADLEGAELKNLGSGGREMKNQAMEYIAEGRSSAPNKQMVAELEALRARNAVLEEDLSLKEINDEKAEGEFAGMSLDQLRDYIKTNSGQVPLGANNRKTLVRLCMDARPNKVA